MSKDFVENPASQLEEWLGVPFVRNLIDILSMEVNSQSVEMTIIKVSFLDIGLHGANPQVPWVDLLLQGVLKKMDEVRANLLPFSLMSLQEFLEENPQADLGEWYDDAPPDDFMKDWWLLVLVRALQLPMQFAEMPEGNRELVVGADEIRVLHKVWKDWGDRTLLEIANEMNEQ